MSCDITRRDRESDREYWLPASRVMMHAMTYVRTHPRSSSDLFLPLCCIAATEPELVGACAT